MNNKLNSKDYNNCNTNITTQYYAQTADNKGTTQKNNHRFNIL